MNEVAVKRLVAGLPPCSTHTGAYCKARQRPPLEMVSTLVRHTGEWMAERAAQSWRRRGRPVRLVDGATVVMPDAPANQSAYPRPRGRKPGLGFPPWRMAGIIRPGSGALLDPAIGKYHGTGGDERALPRTRIDTLQSGAGDAYYAGYFPISALRERSVEAVFGQHGARRRSTDLRCGQRPGPRDHPIELHKPEVEPDWMTQEYYEQTAP